MIKYGTYTVYTCKKCGETTEVPLHLGDAPPLEKYASFCTHDWQITEEVSNDVPETNKEES